MNSPSPRQVGPRRAEPRQRPPRQRPLWRLPLFAFAALSLLAGIAAGLSRLGWGNLAMAELSPWHGPLMVAAFFGSVIALERAVALNRPWAYGAPALSATGGVLLATGYSPQLAIAMMLAGAALFVAAAVLIWRKQPVLYTLVLALGALCWPVGLALWAGSGMVGAAVPAWICFLVLTIAGERLELSRFLPPSRWKNPSAALVLGLLLVGAGLASADILAWTFGLALAALALWMVRHDVARQSVRQSGLTRYMAVCLLSGYVWLGLAGLLIVVCGLPMGGLIYDAALHGLFVGFVFAMVFGHAPVILPAVLRLPVPFHRGFYGPLALLHLSLVLRWLGDLGLGDLADWPAIRAWGGLGNGAAIVLFLVVMVATVRHGLAREASSRLDGRARLG